jgi:hypothetical protein
MNLIPFQKGRSGNPGGRSKEFAECQRIAREASQEAMQKLVALMGDSDARISGWAADKVLERAWGKPRDYDPSKDGETNRPKFNPRLYSSEELDRIEAVLRLMVARQPEAGAEAGRIRD